MGLHHVSDHYQKASSETDLSNLSNDRVYCVIQFKSQN